MGNRRVEAAIGGAERARSAGFSSPFTGDVGEPWGRLLGRLRLVRNGRLDLRAVVLGSVIVTWLPLVVLSVVDGAVLGEGTSASLLGDFLPYGQFLLAVPALLVAERIIPSRLNEAAGELHRSAVVPREETDRLERFLAGAVASWGGRIVNAGVLVITIGAGVASLVEVREWFTGGWQNVGDRLTLAGWWYLLVSLAVLRFLALRWIWRLLVWARFLWRVATLGLRPLPSHPDRAGGLAFLGEAQVAFSWLVFAFGVQLSCLIADQVVFNGADLFSYRGYVAAFVVIAALVLLVPLLPFAPRLAQARYDALIFLSGRGYDGAAALGSHLRERTGLLPEGEVSGLSDFGVLLDNARFMRPVPMEWRHVAVLAGLAVLPFLPLVFLVMPAHEVFETMARLLL